MPPDEDNRNDVTVCLDEIGKSLDSFYSMLKIQEARIMKLEEALINCQVSHKQEITNLHKLLGKEIDATLKEKSYKNVL